MTHAFVAAHFAAVSATKRWHVLPSQPATLPVHAIDVHDCELTVVAQPPGAPVVQLVHVPVTQLLHWPVHAELQHTDDKPTDTQLPLMQSAATVPTQNASTSSSGSRRESAATIIANGRAATYN